MKTRLCSLGMIVLLITTGCQMNQSKTDEEKIPEELNPARNHNQDVDPDLNERLGYVNYSNDSFNDELGINQNVINRHEMADAIARAILDENVCNEIATLVTDQEVLIAYDKNDTWTSEDAARTAQKSTLAITPPFFDMYISDNPALIPQIQKLHDTTTQQDDYDNQLQQIISKMEKPPMVTNR